MDPCRAETMHAATCFRFLFASGTVRQRLKPPLPDETDDDMDINDLLEIAMAADCTAQAGLQETVVLGCIYGHSMFFYGAFDEAEMTEAEEISSPAPSTLVQWCARYNAGPHASPPSRRRWLSCIGGAMASAAFLVDDHAIPEYVVREHCRQLLEVGEGLGTVAMALCMRVGMSRSRLLRSVAPIGEGGTGAGVWYDWRVDGLLDDVWPLDVLVPPWK